MEKKVGPGMYVEYAYKLYNDADGSLLFETPAKQPDMMIFGISHEVVPGLVAALEGLKAGDRFGVTLPPAAAFGDYMPEDVMDLEIDIFMRDGELADEVKKGARLPMMTNQGFRVVGVVKEITDKFVRMDFNHPFAGLTVRYDGEVTAVREATPEELQPAHGCGGGCCGGKKGNCGDGGCGDGCGSGGCGCND